MWLIHPAGRWLLPHAVALGVSANAVSLTGLAIGAAAARAFSRWPDPLAVGVGLLLAVAWLIADGLDGMIARATGTASALGRFLDGLCDHGVFFLIYVALAQSIGTLGGWLLAAAAGLAHAVQSSIYEGERARFHRRLKGIAAAEGAPAGTNPLVRFYDRLAGTPERLARPFEEQLATAADAQALGRAYADRAAPAMKWEALLSANVRVYAIAIACLLGQPRLFWWFELVPLSLVALLGLVRHRAVERHFASSSPSTIHRREPFASALSTRDRS